MDKVGGSTDESSVKCLWLVTTAENVGSFKLPQFLDWETKNTNNHSHTFTFVSLNVALPLKLTT